MSRADILTCIKEKNQKVLVTGGGGYIGSVLVDTLEKSGVTYLSADSRPIEGSNNSVINLCNREDTEGMIREFRPDYIVHCATFSARAYEDDFIGSFRQDIDVLQYILEALGELEQCRVIYFSSNHVYSGTSSDNKVSEDFALLPSSNFGVAKSFFEQFLLRGHPNSVIFRLSSVFGSGNSQHPNTILAFANEAIERSKIVVWGSGSRMMQYVYMDDVQRSIIEAFNLAPGIYNLGGDEYTSVAETARSIADFLGVDTEFLTEKSQGGTLAFMNTQKLKDATEQRQFIPFFDALEAYLKNIKNTL